MLNQFLRELKMAKSIELCSRPDCPRDEKKYKLIDFQAINTTTGKLLILNLYNEITEAVTIVIPDILNVELNSLSNSNFRKYYFVSIVRPKYFMKIDKEKYGREISEELKKDSFMRHRIILHNN